MNEESEDDSKQQIPFDSSQILNTEESGNKSAYKSSVFGSENSKVPN